MSIRRGGFGGFCCRHQSAVLQRAIRDVWNSVSQCNRYNTKQLITVRRYIRSVEASTPISTILPNDEIQTVEITKTPSSQSTQQSPLKLESVDATALVDQLLHYTRSLMNSSEDNNDDDSSRSSGSLPIRKRQHVIAFSGGIDSSVVAALIHQSADHSSGMESVKAVLGLSPAVPADQIHLAEQVAATIGIDLVQIPTTEGQDETYIANDGKACLACKTHLYTCLTTIENHFAPPTVFPVRSDGSFGYDPDQPHPQVILYNGTNADDLKDPTRLGLIAADTFRVRSPLRYTSKDLVRLAGRHLGLFNWQYAASPCLRSRLALGVPALPEHLRQIERAEGFLRERLQLSATRSIRVRLLSKNRAMIEVEGDILDKVRDCLNGTCTGETIEDASTRQNTFTEFFEEDLGFASVDVRLFKTGSVARKSEISI